MFVDLVAFVPGLLENKCPPRLAKYIGDYSFYLDITIPEPELNIKHYELMLRYLMIHF